MTHANLEVLFTPADFAGLSGRDLSRTTCVVFDVLRATSSMLTALAHGAEAIWPVTEIEEALAIRAQRPDVLLAGERLGLRIGGALTGGTEFDLGNSPREFQSPHVRGRLIVMTTTNGTRALRACRGAKRIWVGAFLNRGALLRQLERDPPEQLLLVGAGTFNQAAYEDVVAAGAICDGLWARYQGGQIADSATIARQIYLQASTDLPGAMRHSRNGRRLLAHPELHDDVAFCLETDRYDRTPCLGADEWVR